MCIRSIWSTAKPENSPDKCTPKIGQIYNDIESADKCITCMMMYIQCLV